MSDPADGATTKRNRWIALIQYVQTFGPEGCPVLQAAGHAEVHMGLRERTAMRYVARMTSLGLFKRIGTNRIVMSAENFEIWMEAQGYGPAPVTVSCSKCKAQYSSRIPSCPECGSPARRVVKP